MPSVLKSFPRLAERARQEEWSHEEFLAVWLEQEGASRQDRGGEHRIPQVRQRTADAMKNDYM